jgi:hypothetical protein
MPSRKTTSRTTGKLPAATPVAAHAPRRKPQAIPAVKATSTDKAARTAKPPKLRRKPVRDSFTMPEADFALIATLKARALAGRRETKKSELLRAGLHALAALDTSGLIAALAQLEPVKVGRPKKSH